MAELKHVSVCGREPHSLKALPHSDRRQALIMACEVWRSSFSTSSVNCSAPHDVGQGFLLCRHGPVAAGV